MRWVWLVARMGRGDLCIKCYSGNLKEETGCETGHGCEDNIKIYNQIVC